MKRIFVVLWLAMIIVALGIGCAPVDQAFKGNPELQQAYKEWAAIDPANLTSEQQQLLSRFNWTDCQELIPAFSWIKIPLTVRDMVFLMDLADTLGELEVEVAACSR